MKTEYSNRALSILYLFVINNRLQNTPIILPTNICHDVYFLLQLMGNELLFLDINPDTLEIDMEHASEKIKTSKSVILLWNHTYGKEEVPYEFFNGAKETNPGLIIIDDRCLCNPAFFQLAEEDNIIDLILFSTGAKKQIDLGHGAFGVMKEKYNISTEYYDFEESAYIGLKSSFKQAVDPLQEIKSDYAWGLTKITLPREEEFKKQINSEQAKWAGHKTQLINIYNEELRKPFKIDERFNTWRFNILVKNKSEILDRLKENNLYASGHYPSIGSISGEGDYPVAERLFKHVINLFIDKYYTEEKAIKTTQIINEYGHSI